MATNSDSSGNSGSGGSTATEARPSRYESQKRRDWNTFGQYLRNHRPPLALSRCSGAHVLEFLRYLDQFGKTKVHSAGCPFFGVPQPPAPCPCPLKQAWGSLDALVGRLRAAFEENGGHPDANPFGARAVRLYLREVRDTQAKARGIPYEKKKRKRPNQQSQQQQQQLTPLTIPPSPPPHPQLIASQLNVNAVFLHPFMHHYHQSSGNELQLGHVQLHRHHHHHGLMMSMVADEYGGDEEAAVGVADGRSGALIPLSVLH